MDRLDHDDGVIHDEADGDNDRHQRQIVDAEAEGPHQHERARQRQGNGDARRQRRAGLTQENEHHRHHQRNGDEKRALEVGDGGADRHRAVAHHVEIHACGNPFPQGRDQRLHAIDCLDDIGVRRLGDLHEHGGLALEPAGCPRVADAALDLRNVADARQSAIAGADHDIGEILRIAQLAVGDERQQARVPVNRADGRDGGRVDERQAHVVQPDVHGRQPRRIETHADGGLFGAIDLHLRDALDLRHALGDDRVGEIIERIGRKCC